jgi:hypothetical protein
MSGVRTDDEPSDLTRKPVSGPRSSWATALCVALISLVGAVIVMRWHTRVPAFDQWTLLNFYDAWHAGTATWRDWWAPHNGLHLSVLPRFVLGGVALLSGWNLAATSAVSVVLVVVAMATPAIRDGPTTNPTRKSPSCCARTAAKRHATVNGWHAWRRFSRAESGSGDRGDHCYRPPRGAGCNRLIEICSRLSSASRRYKPRFRDHVR